MRYHEVTPITREEARDAFASGTPSAIREALLSLAYHDADWRWVQSQCLRFAKHEDASVRALAAVSLGHLARIHRVLDLDVVLPVLEDLQRDPQIAGDIEEASWDIKIFLSRITREEAEAAFASRDPKAISDALFGLAYNDADWRWVQDKCLRFSRHEDARVRREAALCLGHLARNHGVLDLDSVLPTLNSLIKDPAVAAQAEEALSDIKLFITDE